MAKLIIYVTGNPAFNSHARGEFQWSPKHQVYIWQGKEYTEAEFNTVVDLAMAHHRKILQPSVKIIEFSDEPKVVEPPPKSKAKPPLAVMEV